MASLSPCRPNKDHLDDAGDVDSVHSYEDPWDNIDGDDLDHPAEEELPTLSSVRDFLVRSNAFNTLRKGLHTFVYPPAPDKRHFQDSADSLDILKPVDVSSQDSNSAADHITTPKTEDSMIHTSLSLPEKDREIIADSFARQEPAAEADVDVTTSIQMSQEHLVVRDGTRLLQFTPEILVSRPGTIDRAKVSVKYLMGYPINWWPLGPPMLACPTHAVRVSWRCVSRHPDLHTLLHGHYLPESIQIAKSGF